MDLKHIGHEHPLVLIQNNELCSTNAADCCRACEGGVDDGSTPSYGCSAGGCKFYLHKKCADLELTPAINHPLHPSHPLRLLPNPPYSGKHYTCNYCRGSFSGLVYHCASCLFDLHINCALLQHFEKLQHPGHDHPLIFIGEEHNKEVRRHSCSRCRKTLSGSVYRCLDCNRFQLHKECADLPLQIVKHPFHPSHPLILHRISSASPFGYSCNFCGSPCFQFVYRCESCNFQLDPDCAQLSVAGNFPKLERSAHPHPLIFIEKYNKNIKGDCLGCGKKLSKPPIYRCLDCRDVYLHKECAELPLEIHHPLDRKHPLKLLQNPPTHSETCCCYLCKLQWKGFVYYCYDCEFGLTPEDVSSLPVIRAASHQHPWILLSRPMSFICDFCGTDGDRTPYLCTTCNLIVHRDCIPLPSTIRIMRHDHPIFHTYFLPANRLENSECRICHKQVNTGYGSYHCSASNCNYIAHVNCATDRSIWDGSIVTENEIERSMGEMMNLITDVIQTICVKGVDIIATEIKHAYHNHNLILMISSTGDEVKDDSNVCGGCMRPVSNPFYACKRHCGFFLHKSCAELPREKRHPSHKHLLSLVGHDGSPWCHACNRFHDGFSYKCNTCYFRIDIQCSLLPDTLKHPSHEHPLFVDHSCQGYCTGCAKKIQLYSSQPSLGYKCMQGCKFVLDFWCLTLPQIAWYKYDKHPLTLTYHDGSDPNQCYCDICEEERDPRQWFYHCAECDNTVHPKCILGDLPFIKLGRTLNHPSHLHPLTFVKNIWNCPPCYVCKKICNGQAIQCTKSDCNFIIHWKCGWKK